MVATGAHNLGDATGPTGVTGAGSWIAQKAFRRVLGRFGSGLAVITARDGSRYAAMVCQSFASLSLEPPLVIFCPSRRSTSWPAIRAAGSFCANVLGHNQEELCHRFAKSGGDKFIDVGWHAGSSGAPVLDAAIAFIECRIERVHDGGDHQIVVGHVIDIGELSDEAPLLFYRGGFGTFLAGRSR